MISFGVQFYEEDVSALALVPFCKKNVFCFPLLALGLPVIYPEKTGWKLFLFSALKKGFAVVLSGAFLSLSLAYVQFVA